MSSRLISRRRFLKASGIAIGSMVLLRSGLYVLDAYQPVETLPDFRFGENTMSDKVLVTYASRTGSSAGVAQAIGKTLSESGIAVDVLPVSSVGDLKSYRAVVAGSAIQDGQWLPEAVEFVEVHRSELANRPFAAFLVCMTLAMKQGMYRDQVATWMGPVRAKVRPVSGGLFAGALDIQKIPSFGDRLKFRISVMAGVWSEGDHRDWGAIRDWSKSLQPLLFK
jgi:menaquinone-dependent protoporphyrinogen oxidase